AARPTASPVLIYAFADRPVAVLEAKYRRPAEAGGSAAPWRDLVTRAWNGTEWRDRAFRVRWLDRERRERQRERKREREREREEERERERQPPFRPRAQGPLSIRDLGDLSNEDPDAPAFRASFSRSPAPSSHLGASS